MKCSYYESAMDFMGIWSSDEGNRCYSISNTLVSEARNSDHSWWGTPDGIQLDGDLGIRETMKREEEEWEKQEQEEQEQENENA